MIILILLEQLMATTILVLRPVDLIHLVLLHAPALLNVTIFLPVMDWNPTLVTEDTRF